MSAMVLPAPDGTFIVWCDTCPREFAVTTELLAEIEADRHNKQDARWDDTMERVKIAAAHAAGRNPQDDGHVHTFHCTFEICGTGPTRAELIAGSRARYRK